eukprot:gb/GECH01013156.1/.p1 GENE.gb/GECH01013156.1/~~gb/GECH01013156.1/.p1  ORF type:complete len:231 (+),score=49.62 gb/GECH01013156.1/:1-693(+)
MTYTDIYRLAILGEVGVGKTSLGAQISRNEFLEDYDPTIEDVMRSVINVDDKPVNLEITDTGGQEDFRSMLDSWIQENEGFALVYSIIERRSLQALKKDFMPKLLKEYSQELNHPPVVVIGNKSDCSDERELDVETVQKELEEVISEFQKGQDVTNPMEVVVVEASAKTRDNVEEAFTRLVRQIRKAREGMLAKDKKNLGKPVTPTSPGAAGSPSPSSSNSKSICHCCLS